ncbi:uncharacterized protein [Palaemon carinicauda]|uniref:uncharacterized protein n=1 Tax=Palaemon carinicauda TaxID=392227 RepID=UPI0035B59C2C
MSIMFCYAQTNDPPKVRKDEYYEELQKTGGKIDEKVRDEQAGLEKVEVALTTFSLVTCCTASSSLSASFPTSIWGRCFRSLLEHNKCKVHVNGVLSNEFPVNTRVHQGNVLSPMLCIVLRDFVMSRTVSDCGERLDLIGDKNLADVEYDSDAFLVSKTPKDLHCVAYQNA